MYLCAHLQGNSPNILFLTAKMFLTEISENDKRQSSGSNHCLLHFAFLKINKEVKFCSYISEHVGFTNQLSIVPNRDLCILPHEQRNTSRSLECFEKRNVMLLKIALC